MNILTICEGIGVGWPSPTINLLTSSESPLPSGKIDMEEASWIASLICVGGVIGNVIFGYVADKFGRKVPLILISIPMIVSDFLKIAFHERENIRVSNCNLHFSDQLDVRVVCTKYLLFVCNTIVAWTH